MAGCLSHTMLYGHARLVLILTQRMSLVMKTEDAMLSYLPRYLRYLFIPSYEYRSACTLTMTVGGGQLGRYSE